jgi:hypothetical protein
MRKQPLRGSLLRANLHARADLHALDGRLLTPEQKMGAAETTLVLLVLIVGCFESTHDSGGVGSLIARFICDPVSAASAICPQLLYRAGSDHREVYLWGYY